MLAILAIMGGAMMQNHGVAWSLLFQSLGTAAAVGYFAGNRQLADRNPLVRAGDWSYGIYLVHVPVITAFFALLVRFPGITPSATVATLGTTLALIVSAAYGALEWALYRRLRGRVRKPETHEATPTVELAPYRRAA